MRGVEEEAGDVGVLWSASSSSVSLASASALCFMAAMCSFTTRRIASAAAPMPMRRPINIVQGFQCVQWSWTYFPPNAPMQIATAISIPTEAAEVFSYQSARSRGGGVGLDEDTRTGCRLEVLEHLGGCRHGAFDGALVVGGRQEPSFKL